MTIEIIEESYNYTQIYEQLPNFNDSINSFFKFLFFDILLSIYCKITYYDKELYDLVYFYAQYSTFWSIIIKGIIISITIILIIVIFYIVKLIKKDR